jgi:hypothetical protein
MGGGKKRVSSDIYIIFKLEIRSIDFIHRYLWGNSSFLKRFPPGDMPCTFRGWPKRSATKISGPYINR